MAPNESNRSTHANARAAADTIDPIDPLLLLLSEIHCTHFMIHYVPLKHTIPVASTAYYSRVTIALLPVLHFILAMVPTPECSSPSTVNPAAILACSWCPCFPILSSLSTCSLFVAWCHNLIIAGGIYANPHPSSQLGHAIPAI